MKSGGFATAKIGRLAATALPSAAEQNHPAKPATRFEKQYGRGMIDSTAGLGETQRMLEAFGSVGTDSFIISWTNAAGDPRRAAPARFEVHVRDTWPNYEIAVCYAPMNRAGTDKDYSAADIGWCISAIRRDFGVEETTAMLLEVSDHARHRATEAIRRADREQGGAVCCRTKPAAPADGTRSPAGF
jgi:hypothetical protein